MKAREIRKLQRALRHRSEHHPESVGISAKPDSRPILSLTRKPKSRVEIAVTPIDLSVLADYRQQLESRSEALERSHRRIAYKDVNPLGNKIHAVQKMKLSSKPLI